MYKAKSEAMKRGAQKRDREPLTAEDVRKFKSTKISRRELRHFSFGAVTREVLFSQLAPIVKGYATAGFRTPKDVARLLNKNGVRTACGEPWNPQLAWFLLHYLYERRQEAAQALPSKLKGAAPSAIAAASKAPLTQEEVVRRLQVLGRVKT